MQTQDNGNLIPGLTSFEERLEHSRPVQKVSDVIFFSPRKLMKHGRCAMEGRWRVPSCSCVNFFPPAYSVSYVQPAFE